MTITTYTNLKQLGFRLPKEDFAALVTMDESRRRGAVEFLRLSRNLVRFPDVPFAEIGPEPLRSVFVDFQLVDEEYCESEPGVNAMIASYARAARILDRFIPGYNDPEGVPEPVALSPTGIRVASESFPRGRLVHVEDDFVVLAVPGRDQATIHYMNDGEPSFTTVRDLSEVAEVFAPSLVDFEYADEWNAVMWSEDDDRVRAWAARNAPVLADDRRDALRCA